MRNTLYLSLRDQKIAVAAHLLVQVRLGKGTVITKNSGEKTYSVLSKIPNLLFGKYAESGIGIHDFKCLCTIAQYEKCIFRISDSDQQLKTIKIPITSEQEYPAIRSILMPKLELYLTSEPSNKSSETTLVHLGIHEFKCTG